MAGLGVRGGQVSFWTLQAWLGEDLTPRCVAVTPEGLDLQGKVSKLATGCSNFKAAFCLLFSGILNGEKSQTKKTTQQQKTTHPPPKPKQTKTPNHAQTTKKTPNVFKTKFCYCLPPSNCSVACLLSRRKKPKHNLSIFVDYERLIPLKTEYGVEV